MAADFELRPLSIMNKKISLDDATLKSVGWDFKWNTRKLKDGERAALIAKGIEGKRLTYRPAH